MSNLFWVCGRFRWQKYDKERSRLDVCWDLQGVFDSEKKAISACKNEDYFIGPVELNKEIPSNQIEWEGAYFPKQK